MTVREIKNAIVEAEVLVSTYTLRRLRHYRYGTVDEIERDIHGFEDDAEISLVEIVDTPDGAFLFVG